MDSTTWTFSVRLLDDKVVEKSVSFDASSDITVENLKKNLDVPAGREYVLSCLKADNSWHPIQREEDLSTFIQSIIFHHIADLIRNHSKLKITRQLSAVDHKLRESERKRSQQMLLQIQKKAEEMSAQVISSLPSAVVQYD